MERYSGFIGQTGGGSGDGSYAVIKISYDVGSQVVVEFDGETYEAPDTSGIWMFGCEETGTYIVKLLGEYGTQEQVEITTKGQIEYVPITMHQTINYLIVAQAGVQANWNMTIISSGQPRFSESIQRDLSEYSYAFINQIQYGGVLNKRTNFGWGNTYNVSFTSFDGYFINNNTATGKYYVMNSIDASTLTDKYLRLNILGNVNNSQGYFYSRNGSGDDLNVICVGFVKEDDISGLSDYGATIYEILSNSEQLFQNSNVILYISRKCTGSFMLEALNSPTFKNAMNNSENKTILLANEHWSKFITYVS